MAAFKSTVRRSCRTAYGTWITIYSGTTASWVKAKATPGPAGFTRSPISEYQVPRTIAACKPEHVAEIPKLFIWQEPGPAGEQFVENLNDHLRNSLDFQGDVRVIHIDGVKDPSDLHIEDADHFVERMQAAMRDARLLSKLARRTASKAPRVPVDLSGPRRYTLDELIPQDLGPPTKRNSWLCPFHDDRNHPNLTIYAIDGKQRFRCQCCGVGGDDIEWLRRMHNMSFRQACEHLGLELPDWEPSDVDLSQLTVGCSTIPLRRNERNRKSICPTGETP